MAERDPASLDLNPPGGLVAELGMRLSSASADEVIIEWTVGPKHWQPMGIVHGGVYCTAIETTCSVGATYSARSRDPNMAAVGLENHTTFLRATRGGALRCIARPLTRGSRTQVWEAEVRDADDRVLATGRVRLLCVPRDAALGGKS